MNMPSPSPHRLALATATLVFLATVATGVVSSRVPPTPIASPELTSAPATIVYVRPLATTTPMAALTPPTITVFERAPGGDDENDEHEDGDD